jgi:hypothetical protein
VARDVEQSLGPLVAWIAEADARSTSQRLSFIFCTPSGQLVPKTK